MRREFQVGVPPRTPPGLEWGEDCGLGEKGRRSPWNWQAMPGIGVRRSDRSRPDADPNYPATHPRRAGPGRARVLLHTPFPVPVHLQPLGTQQPLRGSSHSPAPQSCPSPFPDAAVPTESSGRWTDPFAASEPRVAASDWPRGENPGPAGLENPGVWGCQGAQKTLSRLPPHFSEPP